MSYSYSLKIQCTFNTFCSGCLTCMNSKRNASLNGISEYICKCICCIKSFCPCKVCRHNNKREAFTGSFLIGVLDNPVYCGKLAYGRRHNEKIPGTRNQYHIVKQKDYALYDGIHEPIISEEDWQLAQKQRQQTNKRQIKTHSLDHEHVLSGLLKCPVCGGGMYGNVNRKKKGDGTYYRDYFYYACKHRLHVDGKRCDYHHQWGEEIIDGAVEEIIHKLVNTPAFEQGIREKIGGKLDTAELDAEMETLRKQPGLLATLAHDDGAMPPPPRPVHLPPRARQAPCARFPHGSVVTMCPSRRCARIRRAPTTATPPRPASTRPVARMPWSLAWKMTTAPSASPGSCTCPPPTVRAAPPRVASPSPSVRWNRAVVVRVTMVSSVLPHRWCVTSPLARASPWPTWRRNSR